MYFEVMGVPRQLGSKDLISFIQRSGPFHFDVSHHPPPPRCIRSMISEGPVNLVPTRLGFKLASWPSRSDAKYSPDNTRVILHLSTHHQMSRSCRLIPAFTPFASPYNGPSPSVSIISALLSGPKWTVTSSPHSTRLLCYISVYKVLFITDFHDRSRK